MCELLNSLAQPCLAAEGGTAIGWLFVALLSSMGKWGWIIAIASGLLISKLRGTRSVVGALVIIGAFTVGMICLVLSIIYLAMLFPQDRTAKGPEEVRPVVLTIE